MSSSPFGLLIPPAAPLVPPELEVQTVSANQLAYSLPAAAIGSHLAIFLLPGQTLPAGSAAALYIQFPGQPEFRLLGALGEGKASAVFRVAGLRTGGGGGGGGGDGGDGAEAAPEVDMDADDDDDAAAPGSGSGSGPALQGNVTIGVSLEPAQEVKARLDAQKAEQQQQQQQQQGAQANGVGPGALVVRRGAMSAGSAALQQQQPSTKVLAQRIIRNAFNFLASFEGGTGMVPIKAFEGWWQKFESRVNADPTFLERDQD